MAGQKKNTNEKRPVHTDFKNILSQQKHYFVILDFANILIGFSLSGSSVLRTDEILTFNGFGIGAWEIS